MSKSLKKSKGLEWKPDTWKSFKADQQPIWPDNNSLQKVLDELSALPPLVFAGEARNLTQQLAAVSKAKHFYYKQVIAQSLSTPLLTQLGTGSALSYKWQ